MQPSAAKPSAAKRSEAKLSEAQRSEVELGRRGGGGGEGWGSVLVVERGRTLGVAALPSARSS